MTPPLWTARQIAEATHGQTASDFAITGLSIDTRSLQAGDLFIALQAERDGHDFVRAAFTAGAAGALVSQPVTDGPAIQVTDVLKALEQLGLAARQRAHQACRIAITGSVGKTSLKEMLARMFRALGPTHCNVRSFNNHWGVPLTLARMPENTQFAVFEIGMNTPGEIAPRARMVRPHRAVITKIAPAHLEGLGSVRAVAMEKAALFAGLQPGGWAILPHEDEFTELLKSQLAIYQPDARILTFGVSPEADAQLVSCKSEGLTSQIRIRLHEQTVDIELNTVGTHWAMNAAAALLAACPTPSDKLDKLAAALSAFAPPPGRGTAETLYLPDQRGQFTLIDDAYNANPESMRAALTAFAARSCEGRKLVALGEMLEIGPTSQAEHAALAEPVLATGATHLFAAGAAMQALTETLGSRLSTELESDIDSLAEKVKKVLKSGDAVLLKGSNASGMNRLAEKLRIWSGLNRQQTVSGSQGDPEHLTGGLDAV